MAKSRIGRTAAAVFARRPQPARSGRGRLPRRSERRPLDEDGLLAIGAFGGLGAVLAGFGAAVGWSLADGDNWLLGEAADRLAYPALAAAAAAFAVIEAVGWLASRAAPPLVPRLRAAAFFLAYSAAAAGAVGAAAIALPPGSDLQIVLTAVASAAAGAAAAVALRGVVYAAVAAQEMWKVRREARRPDAGRARRRSGSAGPPNPAAKQARGRARRQEQIPSSS